jgi:sugar phosphate isomerase/epimerase
VSRVIPKIKGACCKPCVDHSPLISKISRGYAVYSDVEAGIRLNPPEDKSRMDWEGIAQALRSIDYSGPLVMEPFVLMGGQVGMDIKIWRELLPETGEKDLDKAASESLVFIRQIFEGN